MTCYFRCWKQFCWGWVG